MKLRAAIAILLSVSLTQASHAEIFIISYTDASNNVLEARIDGVLQADSNSVYVTSVLDFATYAGSAGPSIDFVDSSSNFRDQTGEPALLSLDGSSMDFIACSGTACTEGFLFDTTQSFPILPTFFSSPAFGDMGPQEYLLNNWRMTAVP